MTKRLLYLDLNGEVTKRLLYLKTWEIERLPYLNLELWWPRGFSTLIWMGGNQEASLSWNLGRLRSSSMSILNCDDQGASLPLIWMEGNQEASLSWNLGRLRGFPISILNCDDQGASLPLIWMEGNQKASLSWNLRRLRGFPISILNCDDQGASLPWSKWEVTKRLLYLRTWGFTCKRPKFGIRF